MKNIGSAGRNVKKKSLKTVEYICQACKETEEIPKDIVKEYDILDGGDPMDPPRFSCEASGQGMVPVYYKSVHGYVYDYSRLKK